MIKSAAGNEPEIASGAYIAETAVITGDVTVMPGAFLRNVKVKDGAVIPSGIHENCEIG